MDSSQEKAREAIIQRLTRGEQPTLDEVIALLNSDPAVAAALNVAVRHVAQHMRRRVQARSGGGPVLAA
jgi:FixJ family two-component response regulator